MNQLTDAETEKFIAEPKPGFDRRGHPRESVHLNGLVVDANGQPLPCVILDYSQCGFRMRLSEERPLSPEFGMIDLVGGVGHQSQVVWRDGLLVGARSTNAYDLRAKQDGLGQALQDIWRAALD